jgi:hypothetical protein
MLTGLSPGSIKTEDLKRSNLLFPQYTSPGILVSLVAVLGEDEFELGAF